LTPDFASPTVISNNSATYDPPAGLTATTWYRRQAKDGNMQHNFYSFLWSLAGYRTAGFQLPGKFLPPGKPFVITGIPA